MKKLLLNVSLIIAFLFTSNLIFAQYQLTNSGFENWESVSQSNVSGQEPIQWNSFVTMQTKSSLYNSARANKIEASTDVRPGTTGSKSAKIWSTSVIGVVANGNLTTGRIYGGSMTASDASGNYNFSDPSSDAAFKHTFAGKPDSIATWLKFVPSSTSTEARVSAIIHENSRYQDPEASNTTYSNVVAKAQKDFKATSDKGWQRISVPFVYEGNKTPAYILVSYTTNKTPGKGTSGDHLYIDDAEMIYNSKATSVSFNGTTFSGFNKNTYQYFDVEGELPSSITATVDGVSATYTTSIDAANNRATVVVKGGDISVNAGNYHTYTFNFKAQEVTVNVSAANSTMGNVYINSVGGATSASIAKGTSTTAIAVAKDGYMFKNWTVNGNVVSTNASYTFSANEDKNLVANFYKYYTVTVNVNKAGYGTAYIGSNTNETTVNVEEGQSVTITAVAADGYKFTAWKEDRKNISTQAVYTISSVTSNITYTANFAAKTTSNLAFENNNVDYSDIDNGSFSNTASSTNSEGAITYAITYSSADGIATINATTGVVTFLGTGSITVTATQAAWGDYLETAISYTLDITPTGIEENTADEIMIYATNGAIVVNCNETAKVDIFNMGGALIKSISCNGNSTIDMNNGVYIVKVAINNNTKVERVIVK